MRINSVPDVKCFVIIKMCYVHKQWYDISCATLYLVYSTNQNDPHYTVISSLPFVPTSLV